MRLGTREDNQKNTHALNADGNVATRVIVTPASPDDAAGPSDLLLNDSSTGEVTENLPSGAEIGILSVRNGVAPLTFSITQDFNDGFSISGNKLLTSRPLDSNTEPQLNVSIRCTDTNGKFTDATFLINVKPVDGFLNTKSFRFNGNSFIFVDSTTYNGNGPVSWWTWYRGEQPSSGEYDIFNSQNGTLNTNGIRLSILNTGSTRDLLLNAKRNTGPEKDYRYNVSNFFDNRWHLIGFSLFNNVLRLWIDGQLQTPSNIILDENVLNLGANGKAYIGSNEDGTDNFLVGNLDEIGYATVELTQSEWILIYNNGVAPNLETTLVSNRFRNWYRADNDSLPVVTDSKESLDAVASLVTLSNDAPRNYKNFVSTEFDNLTNFWIGNGSDTIDFTKAKSFVFWVNRNAGFANDIIIGNRNSVTTNNGWSIYFDNNAAMRITWDMEATGANDQRVRWSTNQSAGDWMHFVITMGANVGSFDGNNINCYLNGQLLNSSIQNNTLAAIPTMQNTLAIGAGINGGSKYDGFINEIAVFDKELSAIEAQEAYNLGDTFDLTQASFGDDIIQRWRMGNNNNLTSIMTDDISGDQMTMFNFSSTFYSSNVP